MSVYYWHISTERKLVRGELDYSGEHTPVNIINFWRTIPQRFFHIAAHDDQSYNEQAPSLWEQLQQLRSLSFIRREFSTNPYKFGDIQAYVHEYVFNNIYSITPPPLPPGKATVEHLKGQMLNFVGTIYSMFREVSIEATGSYDRFFESLSTEIKALDDNAFYDLTFEPLKPPIPPTTMVWVGSENQMEELFKQLKVPVIDRRTEIRFLDEKLPYHDFKSVFSANGGSKIEWLERSPRSKQVTLVCLFLLFDELMKVGLIPKYSTTLVRKTIKSHFFNKKEMGQELSSLKPTLSAKSERASRIIQIVSKLSNKK